MKKAVGILVIAGIFAIIIIQLSENKKVAESRVYNYDKEATIPVFGEIVSGKNQSQDKSYNGVFESMNEVKVSSVIQGKITQIFIEEGQKVSKGQALLKIDDTMLRLQLNVLEIKLDGLKKDEIRYSNLSSDDAVPAITLEKTQNAIASIEAEKKTILEQINKSTVKAPFNGVISMKLCETGGFASPAIPLLEIINHSALKFVINVPEEDLLSFTENQDYHIHTSISKNEVLTAELLQVSSKGGIGNSFKVEFSIDNVENIKPKMIGKLAFISTPDKSNTMTISSTAILGSESNPEVYRIDKGRAMRTPVSIISRNGDQLSVKGQIAFGDTIITGGFINLFDNAKVSVNP